MAAFAGGRATAAAEAAAEEEVERAAGGRTYMRHVSGRRGDIVWARAGDEAEGLADTAGIAKLQSAELPPPHARSAAAPAFAERSCDLAALFYRNNLIVSILLPLRRPQRASAAAATTGRRRQHGGRVGNSARDPCLRNRSHRHIVSSRSPFNPDIL